MSRAALEVLGLVRVLAKDDGLKHLEARVSFDLRNRDVARHVASAIAEMLSTRFILERDPTTGTEFFAVRDSNIDVEVGWQ